MRKIKKISFKGLIKGVSVAKMRDAFFAEIKLSENTKII